MLYIPNQKGQRCQDDPQNHVKATRVHYINHIPYTMLEQKHGKRMLVSFEKNTPQSKKKNKSKLLSLIHKRQNIFLCYVVIILSLLLLYY